MNFEELAKIENESERVNRTYDLFHEDTRLNHSKAARVEFLTTVRYIERYLKEGDRILDIGAGAGEYSLYFARKGYEVSALELADANIAAFRKSLLRRTGSTLCRATLWISPAMRTSPLISCFCSARCII
ncbi:MAG: hypothetical protein U0N62_09950 [Hydrogeniiclostridium sp.]